MAAKNSVGSWLGGAVLNILAVLGVVCIVLVILSFVFNVSIIMFKTGSMSPTIPAGSASLVREIPAKDMKVGDIVTVDRGEKVLPVTHRVTEIQSVDDSTGAVTFEMKGDANAENDPDPYTAETVRTVMFSVPGIAPILQQWRNPFLLGGITIAASLLVVWAFWPRRDEDDDDAEDEETREGSRARAQSLRAPVRTPKHAVATPVVVALIVGGGTVGVGLPSSVHAAATHAEALSGESTSPEVQGDVLRMKAYGDAESMRSLSPGTPAIWSVDVWAEAPHPGEIELEIGSGHLAEPLASALLVDVRTCARAEAEEGCPAGANRLLSGVRLSDLSASPGSGRELLELSSDRSTRVEVTVTLDSDVDAAAVAGLTSSVRVTATSHGEEVSLGPGDPGDPDDPGPDGNLPRTGIDGWKWILLAAFGFIVVGSAIVARSRKEAAS